MTAETDRDLLDELLDASAPRVPEPSEVLRAEGLEMVVAAERGQRRRPVRRLPRIAVAGIVAGAVLTGGGLAAAAATLDEWAPWAQEPDDVFTFTLPSGAVCEQRIGNFEAPDPAMTEAARTWLTQVDVLTIADVDGAIQMLRDQEYVEHLADGTQIVGGYGTEHYVSPDTEYLQAVSHAVAEAINDELVRQGFDPYAEGTINLTHQGETHCPGAQW